MRGKDRMRPKPTGNNGPACNTGLTIRQWTAYGQTTLRGLSAQEENKSLRLVHGRLVNVMQLDKPPYADTKGDKAHYREKNNQAHSYFSLIFDNAIRIIPETKHRTTDIPPIPKSSTGFTLSYFMIPANITPPNTSLAMPIRNFQLSDNIVSLLSPFMICKDIKKSTISWHIRHIFKLNYS